MLVKICGLKNPGNIRVISGLQPDMMGFIFYPGSPRYAGNLKPEDLKVIPQHTKRVGVFVNQAIDLILELSKLYHLSVIQLHGTETPEMCNQLRQGGMQVIKAVSIGSKEDFQVAGNYQASCDYLLFDTKSSLYGGTGTAFNWNWLTAYQGEVPFLLSGGISPEDAGQLKEIKHCCFAGVDLNSRFEFAPGEKNPQLLFEFMQGLESNICLHRK